MPYTYPARPTNGGPPHLRRPPFGQWIAQPKFNGWRALIHLQEDGRTAVWNRHGEPLSIAADFHQAIHALHSSFPAGTWLDCEALQRRGSITGTLIVLDCIDPPRPAATQAQRMAYLRAHIPVLDWRLPPPPDSAILTDEFPTERIAEACTHFQQVNAATGETVFEGVVCKRVDSTYPIQLRSPEARFPYWIKHRFD